MVEPQPSKLITRVRFPPPASSFDRRLGAVARHEVRRRVTATSPEPLCVRSRDGPEPRLAGSTVTVSRVGLGCNNFGRRIDREQPPSMSSRPPSTPGSRCSTPPTCTERARASASWARLSPGTARRASSSRRSSGWTMRGATQRDAPRGSRESPARRSIDASLEPGRPETTSTSTTTTALTGVTPLDETLGAMHELVSRGQGALARSLGTVDATHLEQAARLRGGRQQPGRGREGFQPHPSR